MSSFIPVFIACIAGPILEFVVRLGVRGIVALRVRHPSAGAGQADRTIDLVGGGLGVAGLIFVCAAGTPAVWEVALPFAYLWPVILRLVLRVAGQWA